MLERMFKLSKYNTNVKTELIAGLTTFMAMAYIIVVNPQILTGANGMLLNGQPIDSQAVMIATCIGAGLVTLAMGIFVNYPIALAPGMGLNAFYAYTVMAQMGYRFEVALAAVFVSSIIFVILTIGGIRQAIVGAIPQSIKYAVTVGIGLFITIIGLRIGHVLVPQPETFVQLNMSFPKDEILTLAGLAIIAILWASRVKGSILIGIVAATIIGWIIQVPASNATTFVSSFPGFDKIFDFNLVNSIGQHNYFGSLFSGFGNLLETGLISVVLTFTFVEFFDTTGTLIGTASRAGLIKEDGEGYDRLGKAMMVDAAGVGIGALAGTSTVTAYIESSAGIAEGGRTGLSASVVGILFLLALFISPLATAIPSAATAPALIVVGFLMMQSITKINFEDFADAFPAFLTVVMMPFTGSIANGISAGLLAYPITKVANGKAKEVSPIMWVLFLIVIARFVWLLAA